MIVIVQQRFQAWVRRAVARDPSLCLALLPKRAFRLRHGRIRSPYDALRALFPALLASVRFKVMRAQCRQWVETVTQCGNWGTDRYGAMLR
jgi:hypothetical protein